MGETRRRRLNVRIRTILLAIVIVALTLVLVIQQAQLQRLRNLLDAETTRTDRLTAVLREQRDALERERVFKPSASQP